MPRKQSRSKEQILEVKPPIEETDTQEGQSESAWNDQQSLQSSSQEDLSVKGVENQSAEVPLLMSEDSSAPVTELERVDIDPTPLAEHPFGENVSSVETEKSLTGSQSSIAAESTSGQAGTGLQTKPTTYLHLWGGERGGAGKSTGCRVMVHYLMEVKKDGEFYLVETDRSRPDVKDAYSAVLGDRCIEAFFSESEYKSAKADRIFDLAQQTNVLVNLPAQVAVPFKEWVERNYLEEMASELSVKVVMWFACTGEPDSIGLFLDSLEEYAWMEHVLVKNKGLQPEDEIWAAIEAMPRYKKALDFHKFKIINLHKFYFAERDVLKDNPMSFAVALKQPNLFSVLGGKRVSKFLETMAVQFDSTGYFNKEDWF